MGRRTWLSWEVVGYYPDTETLGCPGLTQWGLVVPSQIRALWAQKGEWARVQRRFAQILLCPSFPSPAVPPVLPWKSQCCPSAVPVTLTQHSSIAADRIGWRDARSPVSPSRWPFSVTPLRAPLCGAMCVPLPTAGSPCPVPCPPHWAQPCVHEQDLAEGHMELQLLSRPYLGTSPSAPTASPGQ